MRELEKLAAAARRLVADRRGNFAILGGLTASAVALAAGFGVNIAQLHNVKSGLSNAVDAAVISTARDLTTGVISTKDADNVVRAFLEANATSLLAPGEKVVLGKVTVDRLAGTVEATAHIDVNVFFPLFGTADRQRVTATTASLYSDKDIEVAMMLDVTGSMEGQKIKDLRAAAKNAVDRLLENPRTRVALVPYAESVNVGVLAEKTVFVEKSGGRDLPLPDDATPREISNNTGRQTDNCASERKTPNLEADYTDDGPATKRVAPDGRIYPAKINRDDRVGSCPVASVVPLTSDAGKLGKAIEKFSARGVTAGAIGVQWAYYMLSEKWRAAIKEAKLGDGPADMDPSKVVKVAILMTDGQFNKAFAGTTSDGAASRRHAEGLCKSMKDNGIEIFAIGFDLNDAGMSKTEREQAKAVLKNCSSPDRSSIKHYYEASTGPELDAAYRSIIESTEILYLTM
ncbi:pilus assembly protein [Aminobacter sp. HY435]|uniref:pilus assembly protein n=1 Tax=Aminobacter sp. HY435 TaxID=2970917 RepID=UPI0022B9854C|nr:pilus assembly protein [Aminobacter sp. HY435]